MRNEHDDAREAQHRRDLVERLEFLKDKFGSWREFARASGLSANYFTSKMSRLRAGESVQFDPAATTAIVDACKARGIDVSYSYLWGVPNAPPPREFEVQPPVLRLPRAIAPRKRAGAWRRYVRDDDELELEFSAAESAGVDVEVLRLAAKHVRGVGGKGTPRERAQRAIAAARDALGAYGT